MKAKEEVTIAEITYDEEKNCVVVRLSDDGKDLAKQEETKPLEDLTYDDIKDEIGITICDRKRDAKRLEVVPWASIKHCPALAMTYCLYSWPDEEIPMSATWVLSKELMDKKGITTDRMHEAAMRSAFKNPPLLEIPEEHMRIRQTGGWDEYCYFSNSWKEQFRETINKAGTNPKAFVLSNWDVILGVCVAFYPGVLKEIADDLNSGFDVIFPSEHEALILPNPKAISKEELDDLMANYLHWGKDKEWSWNRIYHYDRKTDTLYDRTMEA